MKARVDLEVPDSPNRLALGRPGKYSSMIPIIELDEDEEYHASSGPSRMSTTKNIIFQDHKSSFSGNMDCDKRAAFDVNDFSIYKKEDSVEIDDLSNKSSMSKPYSSLYNDLRKKGTGVLNLSENECSEDGGSTGAHGELLYDSDSSVGSLDSQAGLWSKLPVVDTVEEKRRVKRKWIEAATDFQATSREKLPRLISPDRAWRKTEQKKPMHNSMIIQSSTKESNISSRADGERVEINSNGETSSLLAQVSGQDGRKGRDVHSALIQRNGPTEVLDLKSGHEELVHSGCVFPNTIRHGKSKNATGDTNICNMLLNELPDGDSRVHIIISSPESEDSRQVRKKGKARIEDNAAEYAQATKLKAQCGRECWESEEDAALIPTNDTHRSLIDISWTTGHDKGKAPVNSFCDSGGAFNREGEICCFSDRSSNFTSGDKDVVHLSQDNPDIASSNDGSNPSSNHVTSGLNSESGFWHGQQKQVMGNRNCRSVHSNDECSSLPRNNLKISCIQSSGQVLNKRSEFYSSHEEGCRAYDDLKERANHTESDEILARQLQEEFDHELQSYGVTEEEDASMAHLYEHDQGSPFDSSYQQSNPAQVQSSNLTYQLRRNFDSSAFDLETSLVSELRRGFSTASMDSAMRVKLFEALEFAFERSNMAVSDSYPPVNDDFTDDDYEMVMAHDEDNYEHAGASEIQINSLPQSFIQTGDNKETCAVCLDLPSTGDAIRHLPCLHKFHKECIDTWLRRKASCPICKSQIS